MALGTVVEIIKMVNISQDAQSSPLVRRSPSLPCPQPTSRTHGTTSTERIQNSLEDTGGSKLDRSLPFEPLTADDRRALTASSSLAGSTPLPQNMGSGQHHAVDGKAKKDKVSEFSRKGLPSMDTQDMQSKTISQAPEVHVTGKGGLTGKTTIENEKNLSHTDVSVASPTGSSPSNKPTARPVRAAKVSALEAISHQSGGRRRVKYDSKRTDQSTSSPSGSTTLKRKPVGTRPPVSASPVSIDTLEGQKQANVQSRDSNQSVVSKQKSDKNRAMTGKRMDSSSTEDILSPIGDFSATSLNVKVQLGNMKPVDQSTGITPGEPSITFSKHNSDLRQAQRKSPGHSPTASETIEKPETAIPRFGNAVNQSDQSPQSFSLLSGQTKRTHLMSATPAADHVQGSSQRNAIMLPDDKSSSSFSEDESSQAEMSKAAVSRRHVTTPPIPGNGDKGVRDTIKTHSATATVFGEVSPERQTLLPSRGHTTNQDTVTLTPGHSRASVKARSMDKQDDTTESAISIGQSTESRIAADSSHSNVAKHVEDALAVLFKKNESLVHRSQQRVKEPTRPTRSRSQPKPTTHDVGTASKLSSSSVLYTAQDVIRPSKQSVLRTASQTAMPPPERPLDTELSTCALLSERHSQSAMPTPNAVHQNPVCTGSRKRMSSAISFKRSSKRTRVNDSDEENLGPEILSDAPFLADHVASVSKTVDTGGSPVPHGMVLTGDMTVLQTFRQGGNTSISKHGRVLTAHSPTSDQAEIPRSHSTSRNLFPPTTRVTAGNSSDGEEFESYLSHPPKDKEQSCKGSALGSRSKSRSQSAQSLNTDPYRRTRAYMLPVPDFPYPPISSLQQKVKGQLENASRRSPSRKARYKPPVRSSRVDDVESRNSHRNESGSPATEVSHLVWYASLHPCHARHFEALIKEARHATQCLIDREHVTPDTASIRVAKVLKSLRKQEMQRQTDLQKILAECIEILEGSEASTVVTKKQVQNELAFLRTQVDHVNDMIAKLV